jgi:NADH-quinone oxidoreductase subunit N
LDPVTDPAKLIQKINVESLSFFGPELVLTTGILVVFLADLFLRHKENRVFVLTLLAGGVLVAASFATFLLPSGATQALFNRLIVHDPLATFFKWLFLCATALAVWLASSSKEIGAERMGEYLGLLLAMCLGMNLMASSTDLLMIYLSVELVSLASYVLAGFRKGDRRAAEASLKYVIFGGVASGVMLFGMSYIYGLFGTTDVTVLAAEMKHLSSELFLSRALGGKAAAELALLVSVVFVLAGIGYKVASVPWHMWCPDVYEGAPTPFTAFLSVGPKAAGFAVAIRFFFGGMAESGPGLEQVATIVSDVPWPAVLGVVAAITMTLGNFAALNQTNLKRLLAYSSIAHAGYLMMGLSSGTNMGNLAVLLYLVVYLLMNVGAFAVVEAVSRAAGSESIFEYRGLSKRAIFPAIAFAVFLFSLTGLPPLAGFIGKFYLFYAVLLKASSAAGVSAAGWWALALIGVLNSAVSLFYYARIVKAMFLETGVDERPIEVSLSQSSLMGGLVAAILILGVYWGPLHDAAQFALVMHHGS